MLKEPFQILPTEAKQAFQAALITWFEETGKSYPWRETTQAYAILVSEMMLQQTQIATVLSKGFYDRWLAKFPDLETLAQASEQDLLAAWEGLGYYNRARNLQKLAACLLEKYDGRFPETADELVKLPGIGPYTAGAVASFAFNEPAPIVDGNIARVFTRLFNYRTPIDTTAGKKQLWAWAAELVSPNKARIYNSALMELGQRICRKSKPDCLNCPVARFCLSTEAAELPIKLGRTKITAITEHAIWQIDNGHILLSQEHETRRKGLWKLPLRSQEDIADLPLLYTASYGITRYKVTLNIYRSSGQSSLEPEEKWIDLAKLSDLPIAAPFRRAINHLLGE